MAAQTWTSLQQTVIVALSQAPPPYNVIPPDFAALFPQATSYAEQRICRDLVLLATRTQDASLTTTAGSRALDLSAMTPNVVTVVEGVALITPVSAALPATGTRISFDIVSLDVIDQVWPEESVTLAPDQADWIGRYCAMRDASTLVLAPTPDATYVAEITGQFQPAPISATNPSTYLSTVYPELLTAACMVFLTGALQRNYGQSSDDPKMALSWEQQYGELKTSALDEEMRRRGQGVGWSANTQTLAKPDRT